MGRVRTSGRLRKRRSPLGSDMGIGGVRYADDERIPRRGGDGRVRLRKGNQRAASRGVL